MLLAGSPNDAFAVLEQAWSVITLAVTSTGRKNVIFAAAKATIGLVHRVGLRSTLAALGAREWIPPCLWMTKSRGGQTHRASQRPMPV